LLGCIGSGAILNVRSGSSGWIAGALHLHPLIVLCSGAFDWWRVDHFAKRIRRTAGTTGQAKTANS